MAISQADGYMALFELPDGQEATLPVIAWSATADGVCGLVNQADIEDLLGKRFNYSCLNDRRSLVSPQPYKEFRRYFKV